MTASNTYIGIADDEALFCRGMRLILEDYPDMKVVLEADNGQTLLSAIRTAADLPDVLLLDLKMPIMNGIEAATIIRKEFPSIHLIVVSSHISKAFILNMIEIGASAYLSKNADPEEVVETIRMVREKGFYYNETVMQVIRDSVMGNSLPKDHPLASTDITAREKEILQLICEEYTTAEIAEKLYISTRTVDGHRNNLLSKLGCRNTAGLVVYAIQYSLIKLPALPLSSAKSTFTQKEFFSDIHRPSIP